MTSAVGLCMESLNPSPGVQSKFESFAWCTEYSVIQSRMFFMEFELVRRSYSKNLSAGSGAIWVFCMKLVDEILSMLQVDSGFPRVTLARVSVPMYEILQLSSDFLRIADFSYIVFFFSFNFYRRGRWRFLLIGILCSFVWH